MNDDPICNERGVPESECPPHCRHDYRDGEVGSADVRNADVSSPTYEQIMNAIGERIWDDAGPMLREGHHRDLAFSTTWQDVMWSVQQGVHDAYGLRGISECDECYQLQDACPAHEDSPLLLENVERNRGRSVV